MTARDAIVEKGSEGRKEIGEYLNNGFELQATSYKLQATSYKLQATSRSVTGSSLRLEACSLQLATDNYFLAAARWRRASNRQTPVATETLRLLTLPAIGRRTR